MIKTTTTNNGKPQMIKTTTTNNEKPESKMINTTTYHDKSGWRKRDTATTPSSAALEP